MVSLSRNGRACHGHVALARHGDEQSEAAASYVGAAILVPRRPLLRALRRHGPDLTALRSLFPHASWELLARRVADVAEYVCTVVDGDRVRRHAPHAPWACRPDRLTDTEHALVAAARLDGVAELGDTRAWHIAEPGYDRTILLMLC